MAKKKSPPPRVRRKQALTLAYARGVKKGRALGWDAAMEYRDQKDEEIAGLVRDAIPPGEVMDATIIHEAPDPVPTWPGRFTQTPTFN